MFGSDPMGYTLEQLISALAVETMGEIGFDEVEVEPEESAGGMWEHIAKVTVNEITNLYEGDSIHPYGYRADEVVYTMRPILEPYSTYPATHKLLSAVEDVVSRDGGDPGPYVNLMIRIFDNGSAKDWRNKRAFR